MQTKKNTNMQTDKKNAYAYKQPNKTLMHTKENVFPDEKRNDHADEKQTHACRRKKTCM